MAKKRSKSVSSLHRQVRIRERPTAKGKSFRVECPISWYGKEVFRQFKTKSKAQQFIDRELDERSTFGTAGSDFTVQERVDALRAIKLLKKANATLTGAAEFYLKHNRPAAGDITVASLLDEYLEKMKSGLTGNRGRPPRERTVSDSRRRLSKFVLIFGNSLAKEVASDQIEEWLHRGEWSQQTKLNYFRVLNTFFAYGIKAKYLARNPMAEVQRPKPEGAEPGILTVTEFERLLVTASCDKYRDLIPFVALGGFCGIRPNELTQLEWSNVNLEEKRVTVPAGIAKGRSIRNIDIPDCAIDWLIQCPDRIKSVVPTKNFRKRWDKLREDAYLLQNWPHDALRHSAGSYHFALHENASKTAAMLGHPDDTMLFKHYRALTTKKEAESYFGILPTQNSAGGELLQMRQA